MRLEELSEDHLESLPVFVREFSEGDRETSAALFGALEWDPKTARSFVLKCKKEKMDWRPKAGKTSVTHYVLIEGSEIRAYGRLLFPVEADGEQGNLEFFVPPARRGRGYGTFTLNQLLFQAVRAGLARALVVCRMADPAAIRCIEHNRGEKIEGADGEWARFWIRFR